MANTQKAVIVTGASQGIGAAVVTAFLERGYNVVGTSRNATKSADLKASEKLAFVDGDIGQAATAQKVADAAIQKFGSIDVVVNNAGIFSVKPFTEYSADDFRARRISKAISTSPSLRSSRCSLRSRAEALWALRHRWLKILMVACRFPCR
jgi:NADP-dependent 3-hydroxy acid dehydrogenase YdfG